MTAKTVRKQMPKEKPSDRDVKKAMLNARESALLLEMSELVSRVIQAKNEMNLAMKQIQCVVKEMKWQPWFAWYPVELYFQGEDRFKRVWLKTIERRLNDYGKWVYR